jgi:hypothetical protein
MREQFFQRVFFGSISAIIASTMIHPLDLIRNNLASENDQKKARIFSKIRLVYAKALKSLAENKK